MAKQFIYVIFGIAVAWFLFMGTGFYVFIMLNAGDGPLLHLIQINGFLFAAVIGGVVYHQFSKAWPKLDGIMPYFSMFGIIYFTLVTTAAGRDNLIEVGLLLFISSVIHNGAGYFFGYWLSRLFRLDKNSARTIAFEVGLQNGGMASGLAASMGKLGTVGLPAAVFSPWMNISGSILANYWRKRPVKEEGTVSKKSID
jgi:BASS family bile acid:Na+ symporter